jgi:hypothetical protein
VPAISNDADPAASRLVSDNCAPFLEGASPSEQYCQSYG